MKAKAFLSLLQVSVFLMAVLMSGRSLQAREEVKVKHILVPTEAEAKQVRSEIMADGGDRQAFTTACRQYSRDPYTKPLGGTLQWFTRISAMDPAVKTAAFEMENGEISTPVQSEFGWHLLYMIGRRDREKKTTAVPTGPRKIPPRRKTSDAAAKAVKGEHKHTGHDHGAHEGHDHGDHEGHDHGDHEGHDHGDHEGHDHGDHAGHDHAKPKNDPNQLVPTKTLANPATSANTETAVPDVQQLAPPPVDVKRTNRVDQNVTVTLASVRVRERFQRINFKPGEAFELNITIKNSGKNPIAVFAPSFAVLGVELTRVGETTSEEGDYSSMSQPSPALMTLAPYEIVGLEVGLNDYFTNLPEGRYTARWSRATLFANLSKLFPQLSSQTDFVEMKTTLDRVGTLQTKHIVSPLRPESAFARNVNLSTFSGVVGSSKSYAHIKLLGEMETVVIELDTRNAMAAQHFADLALAGFYDSLDFSDIQPENYILGGSPTRSGNGAPNLQLPKTRNTGQVKHVQGTASFVSRAIRKGPLTGGEIGSIFFVSLRDHPEWDEEHVPFGKVISGLEVLQKATGSKRFEWITISESPTGTSPEVAVATQASSAVPETPAQPATPEPEPAAPPVAEALETPAQPASGDDGDVELNPEENPLVVISTSKGDLTVELYQQQAPNTVRNFVSLTESGFYSKDASGSGKQKFFNLATDDDGSRISIQAGSPQGEDGGPGYSVRSEPNIHTHVRGALVMMQEFGENGRPVADTGGSQFFICLSDIPYYDTLSLTVFGRVTRGLDVLGKLANDDLIQNVKVIRKKPGAYVPSKITQ